MVVPTMGTVIMCFLASSTPLRMASGTSPALPSPAPTRPEPSPTTTTALNEKRRPPLTTLATRLTWTTFSSRAIPFGPICSCLGIWALELQSCFARGVGQGFDAPVVEVTTAVEHDGVDALVFGALGDGLAHGTRALHFGAAHARTRVRLIGAGRDQRG